MQRTRLKQAGVLAAGIVLAVVMVLLGLWQASASRHVGQQVAVDRTRMPVVPLSEAVSADGTVADVYARRVSLRGAFRPDLELLVGDTWPLRVVTAFELDDGRLVAVVRGGTLSPELAAAPAGHREIVGVFLASDPGEAPPPASLPDSTLSSVRLPRIAQLWPGRVIAGYVTLSAADATAQGLKAPHLELPEVQGSAQNSGYALQWWVFAIASIAASIWIARDLGRRHGK